MEFFSDTQDTVSRFADYVEDLQDVFRCHDVDFGSPEDFFAFARTVRYHSDLRGDVLRVVKSVMESEANISFRTILTVIAVASGGADVATSDRQMSIPVKQVIESLLGVGACRQLDADHTEGLYSDLTVKKTTAAVAADNVSSNDLLSGGEEAIVDVGKESGGVVAFDGYSQGGGEANLGAGEGTGYTEAPEPVDTKTPSFETVASDFFSVDPSQPNPQVPSHGYDGTSNDHQPISNDYRGSNTLAESLTRLELNSLQLKIYLDSIDQRISRMEPRLENVAPLVPSTSAPASHPGEETGARFSATVAAATATVETTPAETELQMPRNDSHVPNREDEPTAGGVRSKPWAVLARGGLPAVVFVGVLLLAAALFYRFGRAAIYAVVNPVSASMTGAGDAAAANALPHSDSRPEDGGVTNAGVTDPRAAGAGRAQAGIRGPSGASSVGAGGEGSREDNPTSRYNETIREVNRPADAPSPPSKPVARTSFLSGASVNGTHIPESPAADDAANTSRQMGTDTSGDEAPPVRTYTLSSVPSTNRLVNVSSGLMAANLLSGPKPSYPTLASLTRTQGNVVMQAVISKTGTVEHLHVIKGHHLLRGAAKSAVRNWRYRPYKVGGVPVEVATIVSVDFSLHH
jgi:TonB family protein